MRGYMSHLAQHNKEVTYKVQTTRGVVGSLTAGPAGKKERGSGSSGHPPGAASRTQLKRGEERDSHGSVCTGSCSTGDWRGKTLGLCVRSNPGGVSEQGVNCNCVI
jgi:hypothetical protein